MDFAMLPPEVNSGRMYAGPGSGPMLAAAAAWDGLAAELQSTAASYGSAISELTGGPWLGPSSAIDGGSGRTVPGVDDHDRRRRLNRPPHRPKRQQRPTRRRSR